MSDEAIQGKLTLALQLHPDLTVLWPGSDRIARALLPVVRKIAAEAEAKGHERGRRDFQFAPEGDNHHNATLCPYCSPAVRADALTKPPDGPVQ